MKGGPHRVLALSVAAVLLILDQIAKYIVTVPLALESRGGEGIDVIPIFQLLFTPNKGVSMGFLTADSELQRWFLVGMTAVIAIVVAVWLWREKARDDAFALGLILGGAIGNISDRVRLGYVVDYANLHIGGWQPFLVFNLADAGITIGVLILLARALLLREKAPKPESPLIMRNFIAVLTLGAATLALSACGNSRGFAGGGPDEMAVTRQVPLVVPPDFALVPPAPGTPNATSTPEANRETIEAMFPPAQRSSSENSTLNLAGRNGSDIAVRSQVGDLQTPVVDKGGTIRDIIAAPEGDGQNAKAVIPGKTG